MNLFSLSSKLDLSLFIEKENFKKIFIICGKKSFDLLSWRPKRSVLDMCKTAHEWALKSYNF